MATVAALLLLLLLLLLLPALALAAFDCALLLFVAVFVGAWDEGASPPFHRGRFRRLATDSICCWKP
jgi:hypothetical protein